MCEMDTPDINAIASLAETMSAEAIVSYYNGKGILMHIVTGGIYPIGIFVNGSTMFVPALQPKEKKEGAASS